MTGEPHQRREKSTPPGAGARRLVLLIAMPLLAFSVHGWTDEPRVGHFRTTFTERSPHSAIETQHRRHHIPTDQSQRYEPGEESIEIFVPETYDGERPFGLLVWVSPSSSGKMPPAWERIVEKNNLIWIGANNAGNERGVGVRMGLALDAVHNLSKQYNIDESRIYAAGFSGGAKVASKLAVIYPEVFDGALAIGGVAFYRPIPIPGKKNLSWRATFDRPPTKMFQRVRSESRIVLLIGTEDFNHQPVHTTWEMGFKEDGFQHVTLLEMPGLGHELGDETWLEKSILALDEPLIGRAKDLLVEASELEQQGNHADAYKLYLQISMHGGAALGEKADDRIAELFEKARLELVQAKRAADAERYAEAADLLLKLRHTYGRATPPEADALMRDLETNPASAAQIKSARDREAASRRETEASAALEIATMLVERDVRRAHDALLEVAADYPDTEAADQARAEIEKLLADPATRAQIQTDPGEVEAQKMLVLADNYRRNRLYAKARQRLEELIQTHPNTAAAERARQLLQDVKKEEAESPRR